MLKTNRDCCDAVAGNPRAGKLLHQLVFWLNSPRAPVFGGHRWVAFTRDQWAEKCSLTFDQVRRSMMEIAQLIVREQHKYGGKVPNFIRLSTKGVEALCAAQVAQKCATQAAQKCATLSKLKDLVTVEKKQKIASASGVASLGESKDSEKVVPEKQEQQTKVISFPDQGETPVATVAEIAKIAETLPAMFVADATKPLKDYHPDSAEPLFSIWAKTGQTVTMKKRGQLKYLTKTQPTGTVPALVEYAVANWRDITYEAECRNLAFDCPELPEIGFLVKFAHVAVHCKALADKKAAQLIADLANPNSPAAKKAAHVAMLHGGAAKMKAAKLLKAAS